MNKAKALLLLAISTVMLFVFTGCGKQTINLDKYIVFDTEGYNTMGTASFYFDYVGFEQDYAGKIRISKDATELNKMGIKDDISIPRLFLLTCVRPELDKTTKLSNGDIVNLKWNVNEDLAEKYFHITLTFSDISYTVEDLDEVGIFDPFEHVEVTFDGISPNGYVTITPKYDCPEMQYITFSSDDSTQLEDDDSITVTAKTVCSKAVFTEKFNEVIAEDEKDYDVEIDKYAEDLDEIPDEKLSQMDKQLQDNFNSTIAGSNLPNATANISLIGNYHLALKDDIIDSPHNITYFIYRVIYSDDNVQDFSYYWYGYYTETIIRTDGTCEVNMNDYVVPTSSLLSEDRIILYDLTFVGGVKDLDTFFTEHIQTRMEKYEYDQNF